MGLRPTKCDEDARVRRTPWSLTLAARNEDSYFLSRADEGVGRGPGGPSPT